MKSCWPCIALIRYSVVGYLINTPVICCDCYIEEEVGEEVGDGDRDPDEEI